MTGRHNNGSDTSSRILKRIGVINRHKMMLRPKKLLSFKIDGESSSVISSSGSNKRKRISNIKRNVPLQNKEFDSAAKQDWLLIICSYKRAETLLEKTLNYLAQTDISFDRIRVIVGGLAECKEYTTVSKKKWDNRIREFPRIIVGEVGLYKVKNFVSRYFPEQQELFFMDDDVDGLFRRGEDTKWKNMKLLLDLTSFISDGFVETRRVGASLFGVYPIHNPFFMRMAPITYNLRFILGRAYGRINVHSPDQEVTVDEVEDFERTIKAYLRDGKVVRFNRVAISKMYEGPGGLAVTRTKKTQAAALQKMAETYPELCQLTWKKEQDRTRRPNRVELKLKDKRRVTPKKEKVATRFAKDWGVSSMVLRKRTPRQP